MRTPFAAALAACLALGPQAQTVPAKGTATSFDVAAWNVEHFGNTDGGFGPSNDAQQQANVLAVMEQAEIDLWALQEIGDADAFQDLVAGLDDEGYRGVIGPSTPGSFQLRLAYVYDPGVVTVLGTRTILSGSNFGGRAPFEMLARVTLDGESRTVRIINVHAKAGTRSDDYADRRDGATELKTYIDDRIARGESVILLGDLNDFLTRSTRSGQPSPYAPFLPGDDYDAATLAIEQAGEPTLCGNTSCSSGSTRDHLLFTSTLAGLYVAGSGDRYDELISSISSYTFSTSDHLPVFARFSFLAVDTDDGPEAGPVSFLSAAPSPFRDATALRFRLDAPADVRLDVVDVLGRQVASVEGTYGAGEHTVPLDGSALAPGLYVVCLDADGIRRTQTVVRAR